MPLKDKNHKNNNSFIKCPLGLLNGPKNGSACTVFNVLHGWLRGQTNEQQNNAPNPKNNAAAGYRGPVKIELLEDAGVL